MRFAIASDFGCGLSWWARLRAEGHDVRVYIRPQSHKTIGDGIVPKAGQWAELLAWAKAAPQTVVLFDSSGVEEAFDKAADDARRYGLPTVGAGAFASRLEKDRLWGFSLAQSVGITLPPYKAFGSFADARAYAAETPHGVFFKCDRLQGGDASHGADTGPELAEWLDGLIEQNGANGRCIVQDKIDGTALSTARWWNGTSWIGPYQATYENKKLMNDNVGPSTGCSFNVVWYYPDEVPAIAELLRWEALADVFRREGAGAGIYDINAIITHEGEAYFLEWTPRLGYDSEMTSQRLISDLAQHLWAVATASPALPDYYDDLAYAIRLGVPPYPWEHAERSGKGSPDGRALRGADGLWANNFVGYCVREGKRGLELASPEGIVGLALSAGDNVHAQHEALVDYVKDNLEVAGTSLLYRTDGAKDCAKAAAALVEAGLDAHPGLLAGDEVE